MAKYEYIGDGTVSIDLVGQVTHGDVVEAPDSLALDKRSDFQVATSGEVVVVVEVPTEQPDQTPADEKQYVYVPDAELKAEAKTDAAAPVEATPPAPVTPSALFAPKVEPVPATTDTATEGK